jgi:hypothetical protein
MAALEAEELLDLPPDDDREVGGQDEKREQDSPEPGALEAPFADALFPRYALRSVEPIRTVDRAWIVGGRVLDGIRAPGRLGHPGTINGGT